MQPTNGVPLLGKTPKAPEVVVLTMMMPTPDGRNFNIASVGVPMSLLAGRLATMQQQADLQTFQQNLNGAVNAVISRYSLGLMDEAVSDASGQATE
jgi:hypothetical protein